MASCRSFFLVGWQYTLLKNQSIAFHLTHRPMLHWWGGLQKPANPHFY